MWPELRNRTINWPAMHLDTRGAIDAYQVNFVLRAPATPGRVPVHISQAWISAPM